MWHWLTSWGTLVEPTNHVLQKKSKQDLILNMWAHLLNFVLSYFSPPTFDFPCWLSILPIEQIDIM